jgi:hypothetical protein
MSFLGRCALLADCWPDLEGGSGTSMTAHKLDRVESLSWIPPVLTFIIERHGGTVLGSTRADLYTWSVDLNVGTAKPIKTGYRQIVPTAARLNVKAIAARVRDVVRERPGSSSQVVEKGILFWHSNNQCSIRHGKLISGAFARTITDRRRRFRIELVRLMKEIGWDVGIVQQAMQFKNSGLII